MARELLLRGGHVVTADDSLRDLPNGAVLIRDDQVAAVGRNLSTSTRDAEVLDVAGRLVVPGLVDTHRHVRQGAIGASTAYPRVTNPKTFMQARKIKMQERSALTFRGSRCRHDAARTIILEKRERHDL